MWLPSDLEDGRKCRTRLRRRQWRQQLCEQESHPSGSPSCHKITTHSVFSETQHVPQLSSPAPRASHRGQCKRRSSLHGAEPLPVLPSWVHVTSKHGNVRPRRRTTTRGKPPDEPALAERHFQAHPPATDTLHTMCVGLHGSTRILRPVATATPRPAHWEIEDLRSAMQLIPDLMLAPDLGKGGESTQTKGLETHTHTHTISHVLRTSCSGHCVIFTCALTPDALRSEHEGALSMTCERKPPRAKAAAAKKGSRTSPAARRPAIMGPRKYR